MRVKPLHRSIPSSTRRPGQQIYHQPEGQDKKIKIPRSSSGGAWHRRHPFRRHTLAERKQSDLRLKRLHLDLDLDLKHPP
jgi:hypothetical protein